MIDVYHHITDPAATDASIYRALKPGARLLINDFPPTIWVALFKVKGVPANRGGHGVPDDIVVREITAARDFARCGRPGRGIPAFSSGTATAWCFPSRKIPRPHRINVVDEPSPQQWVPT
jgi:hypothetical protein